MSGLRALNVKGLITPQNIEELFEGIERYGERALLLAGGTSLLAFERHRGGANLISLKRMGFDHVKDCGENWSIGAMATISSLPSRHDSGFVEEGLFKKVKSVLASPPLRNLITAGGNSVQVYYWCDLPPLLLALGAGFVLKGREGERVIPAAEFFSKPPKKVLRRGEVLTAIRVPHFRKGEWKGGYIKFSRTVFDFALASCCVLLKVDQEEVLEARIAFGALSPLPFRFGKGEEFLKREGLRGKTLHSLFEMARDEVTPAPDFRTEAWYKKRVAAAILHDCIEGLIKEEMAG